MDFSYCLTSTIHLPVSIKVSSLEGVVPSRLSSESAAKPDYYVSVQVFGDNKPLTLPVRTAYKPFNNHWKWNEWLTLPIKYADLPSSAQLAISIWYTSAPRKVTAIGGTTMPLFGKHSTLRKGKHKLFVWQDQEADGRAESRTPSKVKSTNDMDKLEKFLKRYDCGDIQPVEWLDKLAFRQIQEIHQRVSAISTSMSLYIELPKFDFPVVYGDTEYGMNDLSNTNGMDASLSGMASSIPPTPTSATGPGFVGANNGAPLSAGAVMAPALMSAQGGHAAGASGAAGAAAGAGGSTSSSSSTGYSVVLDPDLLRDNLVEAKHRRLVRSHRNGPLDRDLKPNPKIRDELNTIMTYPPTQSLTTEEKDLVWKFRFYLTRDKRALTKFLKCVVWLDPTEVRQAVDLLSLWTDIDVDDALELLGKEFENRAVRSYAVDQLRKADDDDLLLYLLQLVQALKFEHFSNKNPNAYDSSLVQFLIDRATRNPILGNYFHWYLMVECEDKVVGKMYAKVAFHYFKAILEVSDGHQRRDTMRQQGELIQTLAKLSKEIRDMKDVRSKKVEKLRAIVADPKGSLSGLPSLPLPLDPTRKVCNIEPEKSGIFNSNLQPLRLAFTCDDGTEYPVIFKTGDDLRQDQLVIQIITLMDKLLRKENLDLKLTPYKVLATGPEHGLVQFIPSKPLAAVLDEHQNNVLSYFRQHHPDAGPNGIYGIDSQVMETYIRSCAGYCVITYLLGVGDRHLDNLLLSPHGHLFHVDFGFILGRDPKPFPPPMKLCKEMIEAMGGAESPHYNKFRQFCYTAFTTLRRNANLILNLFALMVDANIPDIKIEPDKAVIKVQEKFRLDLSEEAAIAYFQGLISESVNALFPQIMETVHKWAQYWRK